MPRWAALLPLLIAMAPAAAGPAPAALDKCIQARTAVEPGGDPIVAANEARGLCFDIASNEAELNLLRVNQQIYANQLMQNNVLLVVVVLITMTGLALSALQLWLSYKLALTGQSKLGDAGDISISQTSVAVKSSYVGVLILAISLAFFTLYITYVYQLRPYSAQPGASGALTLPAPAAAPLETPPPGNMTQIAP